MFYHVVYVKEGEGDKSVCKFPNINYKFIFFFAVFEGSRSATHLHAYQRTLLKITC